MTKMQLKISKLFYIIFILWIGLVDAFGQIGVGTTTPDSSAILDVTSTTKGFLLPRIANVNLINNPAEGLMIYHTKDKCIYVFNGDTWVNLCPSKPKIIEQITLTSSMLIDSVTGGSLQSGLLLIDEQTKTSKNGLHPTSLSWKPHYNMSNGPYSIYFDLQTHYFISEIGLHDMHNIQNLDVSYGEPGNWQPLLTESCDGFKTWKTHTVNIETRYIRFEMNQSVYAAINEISLYGYEK